MRKVVDLNAPPIQFQAPDQYGNLVNIGAPYTPAHAAPQLPPTGFLDYHREIDLGLQLGKASESMGPDDSVNRNEPDPIPVTYVPHVLQLFHGHEHYQWTESLKGISESVDLPRVFATGIAPWTIESTTPNYKQSLIVSQFGTFNHETGRSFESHDRGSDDAVSLSYQWDDGLSALASVTTHLHQAPVDDWVVLGALPQVLDGESYVNMTFQTGEDDVPGSGDHYWSITGNPFPQNIVVGPEPINWIQGESAAAAGFALLDVLAPEGVGAWLGFGSAILGETTNFTDVPPATTEPWAYTTGNDYDAIIDYWNTQVRVAQADYKTQLPLRPDQHYWQFVRWHVDGQPATVRKYYLGDKWGAEGYEGQTIDNRETYKGNPLDGHLLYRFDFPSLHNEKGGGGNGGSDDPIYPGGGMGSNPPGGGGGQ